MQLCSSNIWTNKLTFIYLENVVRLVLFVILFKTAKNLIWLVVYFSVHGDRLNIICSTDGMVPNGPASSVVSFNVH